MKFNVVESEWGYTAMINGLLLCLQDNEEVVWRYKFSKPVFTSPSLLPDHSIIVGCVNGELVKFAPDGTKVGSIHITHYVDIAVFNVLNSST